MPAVDAVVLLDQLDPVPGPVPEFLDRRRRHETGSQQSVSQQVGDPLGIVLVGLASRDILNVIGLGQQQREMTLEHIPYWLPVDPGGFHGDVHHLVGVQQPSFNRCNSFQ